jgi:Ca-activated chloride channel family protein
VSARACVVLALLALVAEAPLSAQQSSDDPTFKVEVSLVHVLVTVKDPSGAPIADLEKEDFTVLDGGVERQIAIFERRTNRPLSVALMVDTSLSTAKELDFERESAKRFVRNLLGPGSHRSDRVGIFQFSVYVELLTGFTASTKRLAKALNRIQADSGTSMYDGILLAAGQLRRRPGRKVMIIITDGGDTTSNVPYRKALEEAHAVDAVIYGIIVMPITADAGRNVGGENALKALAASTGGTTFIQHAGADLDRAFNEILRNLRTQYLIAYYPPEDLTATESFRRTSITVNRPNARVLARNGYFVPATPKAPPRGKISLRPRAGSQDSESQAPIEGKTKRRSQP